MVGVWPDQVAGYCSGNDGIRTVDKYSTQNQENWREKEFHTVTLQA